MAPLAFNPVPTEEKRYEISIADISLMNITHFLIIENARSFVHYDDWNLDRGGG